MNATCILPAASVLAEGPVWHQDHLWWVDIERGEIHALNPVTAADRAWKFPHNIGFAVPSVRGDFIIGTEQGLFRFSPETGQLTPLAHPERNTPGNRFNDAKCDPSGRLWAGTMALDASPDRGSLYRVDPDLRVARIVPKVSISNGLAWAIDGRTLYYIDSPTRRVDAFDFEPTSGEVSGRRTIVEVSNGFPDGMCVDHQGNLWIAIWGGWCVACHEPRRGKCIAKISVPVRDVTSCCFGPRNTLYITTSSRDVDDSTRPQQPLAGGLFSAQLEVSGPPPTCFAG